MTTSIKLLFDKIMNDPDIIPPSGQKKEDVALAIAQQRVKQSENNRRALNLAKSSSSVKKFFDFIQLSKAKLNKNLIKIKYEEDIIDIYPTNQKDFNNLYFNSTNNLERKNKHKFNYISKY